jgi:hypothetical protein
LRIRDENEFKVFDNFKKVRMDEVAQLVEDCLNNAGGGHHMGLMDRDILS